MNIHASHHPLLAKICHSKIGQSLVHMGAKLAGGAIGSFVGQPVLGAMCADKAVSHFVLHDDGGAQPAQFAGDPNGYFQAA